MIRQMDLEQVQIVVDGVHEPKLAGEGVHGTDAAVDNAARALGNLIVDVTGGKHGTPTIAQVAFVEASFKPALAVGQFAVYSRVHSKSILASRGRHSRCPGKHCGRFDGGLTWDHTAALVEERLRQLKDKPIRRQQAAAQCADQPAIVTSLPKREKQISLT